MTLLGRLFVGGESLTWPKVWGTPRRRVVLPSYPFQRQRYWFTGDGPETAASAEGNSHTHAEAQTPTPTHEDTRQSSVPGVWVHPLLGWRLDLASREIVYETDLHMQTRTPLRLPHQDIRYLADHCVAGTPVLPATGYLELALAAGRDAGFKVLDVRDLKIRRPLALADDQSGRVQVVLTPDGSGFSCRILQWSPGQWSPGQWHTHATCRLEAETDDTSDVWGDGSPPTDPVGTERAVAAHYANCRAVGLEYGPAFQGLRRLVAGDGRAWGHVQLPEHLDPHGYLVHPALLDACLQVISGALPTSTHQAWLPVKVSRYHVHEPLQPLTKLHVQVRLQPPHSDGRQIADIRAVNDQGHLIMQLDSLHIQRVETQRAIQPTFREQWIAKPRGSEPVPVVPGLTSASIAGHVEARRSEIIAQTGLQKHMLVLDELERLCGQVLYNNFSRHGHPFVVGHSFTTHELADSLSVLPQHMRLLRRLLNMLEEDKRLRSKADRWTVMSRAALSPIPSCDPDTALDAILQQHPSARPEVALLQRCTSQLLDVLRGTIDPLRLLFPSDHAVSAGDLYRDSIGGRTMNALIAEAVAHIATALPPGRSLRILEVGAGTGATTESILAHLPPNRAQYVFTDIAASFLPAARERLGNSAQIDFRVLDIERDPASQGFALHSFDVIVAANVLHATRNLHESLTHIRRLLARGGHLIVLEGTRPVRWLDLTFGLTSGWWRFADSDLRPDYPLLSIDTWRRLLDDLEFSAIRVIPPLPPQSNQDRELESVVLLAQVDEQADVVAARDARRWLVLADEQGYASALTNHLQSLSSPCLATRIADHVVTGNESSSQYHAFPHICGNSLAEHVHAASSPTDVVFLWSLDATQHDDELVQQTHRLNELLLQIIQTISAQRTDNASVGPLGSPEFRLWVVTRGAQASNSAQGGLTQACLWGFVRTLALELPQWDCRLIDLDPLASTESAAQTLIDEVCGPDIDVEGEILFRDGMRLVRRLVPNSFTPTASDSGRVLLAASRGTLGGLTLGSQPRRAPQADEVEIEVHASGLNFRDVLSLLGQYPGTPPLGAECAGRIVRVGDKVRAFQAGEPVVAIGPDSFRDYLTVSCQSVVQVPDGLSLDEAATIPIAFLTASIALFEIGQLSRGQRVLIHSATGGVGLAAVQLAQAAGAEVFATASEGKYETLRQLGIQHVYDSRRTGFADGILGVTTGSGVDVVLNTLDPEFLAENLRTLASGGSYVDITKTSPTTVQPALDARCDVIYRALDLAALLQAQPERIQSDLRPLLDRCAAGQLHPLPARSFALADAENAFRYMRTARHIGKILIRSAHGPCRPALKEEVLSAPTKKCGDLEIRREAWYLVTGGFGGLGLAVARWLTHHGARHIGLLARRQPTDTERQQIEMLIEQGATIEILAGDVSRAADVDAALATLRRDGKRLAGVFHLAGVLDDAFIVRQSPETFARVFAAKVDGTWNLHRATRADSLDYFVLFSSAAATFGSPGQANHAAANAFLDALARYRRAHGLPGQSINWGPWSGIGAAVSRDVVQRGDLAGIGMITPAEGFAILEQTLLADHEQVCAVRLDWDRLPVRWKEHPLFERLAATLTAPTTNRHRANEFLATYLATPKSQQGNHLLAHLRSLVALTLGLKDPASIPSDQVLADIGLDSLASLELSHRIEESFATSVSSTLVFDYPTLNDMVGHFVQILPTDSSSTPVSSSAVPAESTVAATGYPEPLDDDLFDDDAEVAAGATSLRGGNSEDVLRGIRELSQELDRWDHV
ncbi:MAG: SDR family NAD(P)-dependent oxidoreductase [Pirellulaceae bacterium]